MEIIKKMSVHGSRTLEDERVKIILLDEIEKNGITHLVTHGEPGGVCEIARKLSRELPLPITLPWLNFKYRRGAFEWRSKAVLKDADFAVFIHDGKSKGCSNEMVLAKKLKVKSSCYQLNPSEFKTSVGFEVEKEWNWDQED